MPWTTPKTWISGELVNAATMNAQVRDQFTYIKNVLGGHATDTQQVILSGANGIGGTNAAPALGIGAASITDSGFWHSTGAKGIGLTIGGNEAWSVDDVRDMYVYGTAFEVRPGTVTYGPTTLPAKRLGVDQFNVTCTSVANPPLIVNRDTSTGTIVSVRYGSSEQGTIAVAGDGTTIQYNTFLGSHFTQLEDGQAEPPAWGVVIATGRLVAGENTYYEEEVWGEDRDGERYLKDVVRHERREGRGSKAWREVVGPVKDNLPMVGPAEWRGDGRAYGVWLGRYQDSAAGMGLGRNDRAVYSVAALGLGKVRVTDTAGDIAAGDYLWPSERPYEAERQDMRVLVAGTVAKALVAVAWAEVEVDPALGYKWAVVPATLHAG